MSFLYLADPALGAEWARHFREKAPGIEFRTRADVGDPSAVRYVAAWRLPAGGLPGLPNLEIVFCTGAGVDLIDLSAIPANVALVRMIEPGLVEGMVEYVTMAVLSIHRDWMVYAAQQSQRRWKPQFVRAASAHPVGVMGLGVLGRAVLEKLRGFGYPCAGWSRSRHAIEGVQCYAGEDELPAFLARCNILVCLLPLTADTRGILDRRVFDALPEGAAVVNAGRGGHLVQDDLLAALDAGRLSWAILDVAEPEPLPPGHPLWAHPRVVITPHIASETRVETAVEAVLENIRRHRRGESPVGLVDRPRGY